jgi:hypothetical protein
LCRMAAPMAPGAATPACLCAPCYATQGAVFHMCGRRVLSPSMRQQACVYAQFLPQSSRCPVSSGPAQQLPCQQCLPGCQAPLLLGKPGCCCHTSSLRCTSGHRLHQAAHPSAACSFHAICCCAPTLFVAGTAAGGHHSRVCANQRPVM